MKRFPVLLLLICFLQSKAEDGYRLWLRYDKITNIALLNKYRSSIRFPYIAGESVTIHRAKEELSNGLTGLLGNKIISNAANVAAADLLCGTTQLPQIKNLAGKLSLDKAGTEGFVISTQLVAGKKKIVVAANTDIGVLYGVFHFLRLWDPLESTCRHASLSIL